MIGVGIGLSAGRRSTTRTFTGSALGGFSSSNKLVSAAGQVVDFRPGRTLWLAFQSLGTVAATTETILACVSGTFGSGKGFWLTRAGTASGAAASHFFVLSPNSHALDLGATNQPAANGITIACFVWRASDGAVLVSINGGPLASSGTCAATAPDSSCVSYLGGPEAGLGSIALTSGRALALAVWSSEASSAQALAGTFTQSTRFALPSSVTGNAGCTFDFLASRDFVPGAGTCVTHGTSPVTFAVSGTPLLTPVAEKRFTVASAMYFDSKRAVALTDGNGYRFTQRDTQAQIGLTTDGLYVAAETYSTMFATFAAQSTLGLYKAGAFVSQTAMRQDSSPQILELQPGAGSAKVLRIWEGQQDMTGGTTRKGTFVQAIRVPTLLADGVTVANTSIAAPTRPQKRLVIIGDSITTSFIASVPMQTGLAALLRADYPTSGTGGVTFCTAGTDSIHNVSPDAPTAAIFAALIAAECDGTVSNDIWIELSTNDYGFWGRSAAAFQVEATLLVAALHAAVPSARIFLQSAIQRIAPAIETVNPGGSTLGDFRAVYAALAAANPTFCTYVEFGGGVVVSNANMNADGIHLADAGFVQLKASIKTAVGY